MIIFISIIVFKQGSKERKDRYDLMGGTWKGIHIWLLIPKVRPFRTFFPQEKQRITSLPAVNTKQ